MSILEHLVENSSYSSQELIEFLDNAPRKYKVFHIPKRTYGFRTIAQPIPELKDLQRIAIKYLENQLPVHKNAMAYLKGKGIKQNATKHCKNKYFLKLDFENFFNSVNTTVFWQMWSLYSEFQIPLQEQAIINNLLFWRPSKTSKKLVLSIGAPSSPFISNFCMFQFDEAITELCLIYDVTYTRYADDLTFSTNTKNVLFDFPKHVTTILLNIYQGQLRLNSLKTKFSSKAHNRHVTGITITNDKKISLGRSRKRYIKSLVYKYMASELDNENLAKLKGLLSFSYSIEPTFILALKLKYSAEIIDKLFEKTKP
ncbi:retron St85 family RNA-directed DNA polymerase [Acinetobacter johnsonii]|uniref:retron St85 family RNA-directed DNA polymerase n=1 Tax=Acinetobacter johnsonii TaxID=40214 RepID=UPI001F3FC474|nr:retron St85 family RNA-directed DNA polymerase [Acinetobacter johnsonii]UIP95947.1 retron St85 family RNA-directed DNA polymerase [Acinetobacter johnsonii]